MRLRLSVRDARGSQADDLEYEEDSDEYLVHNAVRDSAPGLVLHAHIVASTGVNRTSVWALLQDPTRYFTTGLNKYTQYTFTTVAEVMGLVTNDARLIDVLKRVLEMDCPDGTKSWHVNAMLSRAKEEGYMHRLLEGGTASVKKSALNALGHAAVPPFQPKPAVGDDGWDTVVRVSVGVFCLGCNQPP